MENEQEPQESNIENLEPSGESKKLSKPSKLKLTIILVSCVLGLSAGYYLRYFETDNSEVNNQPSFEQNVVETEEPVEKKDPKISYKQAAKGFNQVTDIVYGNERLYIVEREGLMKEMDTGNKVLDLSKLLDTDGPEKGFLSAVFSPNFNEDNHIFVYYFRNVNSQFQTVLARYEMIDDKVDTSTAKILLTIDQFKRNHNGGKLLFGLDGYLYLSLGDGGGKGDQENNAQNTSNILGSIIRIDVVGKNKYEIPEDNPFVDNNKIPDEMFTYGWRNPWRMTQDKETGIFYIADVGQNAWEEINTMTPEDAGANYGWRCYEGEEKYDTSVGCKESAEYKRPYFTYAHDDSDRCTGSITGGVVYRGEEFPNLQGHYLFADYCANKLYNLNVEKETPKKKGQKTKFVITTFGEDADGNVYFADYLTGKIFKVIDES
jgi:glucose/arabinose dehydrogenase